jgi:hypothetical protein
VAYRRAEGDGIEIAGASICRDDFPLTRGLSSRVRLRCALEPSLLEGHGLTGDWPPSSTVLPSEADMTGWRGLSKLYKTPWIGIIAGASSGYGWTFPRLNAWIWTFTETIPTR